MMLRRNLDINGVARASFAEAMADFSAHLKKANRRGLVRAAGRIPRPSACFGAGVE